MIDIRAKSDPTRTMRLNHLSFPSTDAAATVGFFKKYLGFTIDEKFSNGYILKRAGFDVVIENARDPQQVWPANFHLGFELGSVAEITELYERFCADGVELVSAVVRSARGSRFFCKAPGGLMFELNTRADAACDYKGTFASTETGAREN